MKTQRLVVMAAMMFVLVFKGWAVPDVRWADGGGGGSDDYACRIAGDAARNSYVAGVITDSARLVSDIQSRPGRGASDLLLVSYDSTGIRRWINRDGGPGVDRACDVTVVDGHVYVTGFITDSAMFGTGLAARMIRGGTGLGVAYVACYDALTGGLVWVRGFSASASCEGSAICADGHGSLFVAGSFRGTMAVAETTLTASGSQSDLFLLKISDDGNDVDWACSVGGSGEERTAAIALDVVHGFVTLTGTFHGVVGFGGVGTVTAHGFSADVFVAAFDASTAAARWCVAFGGAYDDLAGGIGCDDQGNAYVTGTFIDAIVVAGDSLLSAGGRDMFLASIDTGGHPLWGVRGGGALDDEGRAIAMTVGGVAVGGVFQDSSATFGQAGGGVLARPARENRDMFVALYSLDGVPAFVKAGAVAGEGGCGIDAVNGLVMLGGIIYVAGEYVGDVVFEELAFHGFGGRDIAVVSLTSQIDNDVLPDRVNLPKDTASIGGGMEGVDLLPDRFRNDRAGVATLMEKSAGRAAVGVGGLRRAAHATCAEASTGAVPAKLALLRRDATKGPALLSAALATATAATTLAVPGNRGVRMA